MEVLITIPEYNYDWLQEKINKLNKKEIKLNCSPITLEILNTVVEEIKDKQGKLTGEKEVFLVIQINGEAPKLSDWIFIGKLEEIDSGKNLISSVPGYEIPVYYRSTEITCDHCGINRYRKYTYLVQHEITKQIKQVGKSCLKDFLGHPNPEMYAGWAESLMNLEEKLTGDMPSGRGERYFDIIEYLYFVAEEIKQKGWRSKTTAFEYGGNSTANDALHEMFPPLNYKPEYKPSEESKELAKKALEWIKFEAEIKEDNQYMYNLNLLCSQEYMKYKTIGIVASLIVTYQKAMEYEIKRRIREEQKKQIINEYLGNIKDKITQPVTVLLKRYCDGIYSSTLYKFVTDEGYILIWFASGINEQLDQGDTAVITGTIKDHQDYQGNKQTIITRCKIK